MQRPDPISPPDVAQSPTDPVRARLLIIDDNEAIHEDFRKTLSMRGRRERAAIEEDEALIFGGAPAASTVHYPEFEVDVASQGQEGVAKVKAARADGRPYSFAFVDMRMPPGWD